MGHIRGKREQVRNEHLLNVNCKLTLTLIWEQYISKIEKKKPRVLTKKVYIQIKKILKFLHAAICLILHKICTTWRHIRQSLHTSHFIHPRGERHCLMVKCLAQEHNTMSPAWSWTRTRAATHDAILIKTRAHELVLSKLKNGLKLYSCTRFFSTLETFRPV